MALEVPLRMHWGIYPTDRVLSLLPYPAQIEFGPCPEGCKSILGGGAPHVKLVFIVLVDATFPMRPRQVVGLSDALVG